MNLPIMICGFNRPQCLSQVFNVVRKAKPNQLFLVLDHPREGHPNDIQNWEVCKRIFKNVDWECEVHRNYAESNMGCRRRMGSAITWTFEHVDRAVIIEDDCVADASFFPYVAELLERYKDDGRIGGICGFIEHYDFCGHPVKCKGDYYFDRLNTCCCWATWRRAWKSFDADFSNWPKWKDERIFRKICRWRYEERKFERIAQSVYEGRVSSWATIWWLSCLANNMLFSHPVRNMVTNIGFGDGSTHTRNASSPWANLPVHSAPSPICHPESIEINSMAERFMVSNSYAPSVLRRVARKIRNLVGGKDNAI